MKPEDLRIGNWILTAKGHYSRVKSLDHFKYAIQKGEPILLTYEILSVLPFDYLDSLTAIIKDWSFKRSFGGTGLIFHYDHFCNPKSRQVTIPYLHQLQNLYYSLTNEELTITL